MTVTSQLTEHATSYLAEREKLDAILKMSEKLQQDADAQAVIVQKQRKKLAEFVGANIRERYVVIGEKIVIVRYADGAEALVGATVDVVGVDR